MATTKVTRSHTFSDGKVYKYVTLGNLVIDDDVTLGTTKQLDDEFKKYEEKVKKGTSLGVQGVFIDDCESAVFFWCTKRTGVRWPDTSPGLTVIPYFISPGFSEAEKITIRGALMGIQNHPNSIIFSEIAASTTATNYIVFTNLNEPSNRGCHSALGFQGGRQDINLGTSCVSRGVITHETGHALGMIHELQRWDRNNFVTINEANLTALGKQEIFQTYNLSSATNITGFDISSIMVYRQYAGSRTPYDGTSEIAVSTRQPYYFVKSTVPVGTLIGQGDDLTPSDIAVIDARY